MITATITGNTFVGEGYRNVVTKIQSSKLQQLTSFVSSMASLSAHSLQFSGNTLDKYHCLGSAQVPGAPRLQYLTLCLNGTPSSSK